MCAGKPSAFETGIEREASVHRRHPPGPGRRGDSGGDSSSVDADADADTGIAAAQLFAEAPAPRTHWRPPQVCFLTSFLTSPTQRFMDRHAAVSHEK